MTRMGHWQGDLLCAAGKEQSVRLAKWIMLNNELIGEVLGSERYEDGTLIHTSAVVTMAYDDGLFLMRTGNSIYECLARDFAGKETELEMLIANAQSSERQTTEQIHINMAEEHPEV